MITSTNDLLERVRRRSCLLHKEALNELNLSEDNFNSISSKLSEFSSDVFEGKNVSKEFAIMDDLNKQIAVMTVCIDFADKLDQLTPNGTDVPEVVHQITKFLEIVPPKMALVGLRVEVCVERFITWNLDLLPGFSKIIENIHKSVNNS